MAEKRFHIGDTVTWESQSQGSLTRKAGTVLVVVPAGEDANKKIPDGYKALGKYGFGAARGHESYIVRVGKSKRLYWPCVKNLCEITQFETKEATE